MRPSVAALMFGTMCSIAVAQKTPVAPAAPVGTVTGHLTFAETQSPAGPG